MTKLLLAVATASLFSLSAGWANAQWTAYNDLIYSSTNGHPALQPNVTTYNIGNNSPGPSTGELKDKATGTSTGVTATLTQSGNVVWQPDATTGGSDCNSGTDARSVFDPATTASLMGTVYYGSTGWWVDVTFTGLNPTKLYTFVTTANRNDATYTDRLTKYTISGADAFTNASTAGTTIGGGGASTTFCTGYNTVNGYVARWTGINPGADGSFSVRAEAGSSQYKAYAFDAFQLAETSLTTLRVSTLDATDVQPTSATLIGQLTAMGAEPPQVWFQWGTSPTNLDQATPSQVLPAPGVFSAPLTGLAPETVYYFKAMATAQSETTEGAARSFVYTDNYGLQFDGAGSHVTMGAAPGLGSATFTIETWFKRTGTGLTANSGSGGVNAVPLVCKGVSEGDGSNIDANYFFGIRTGDNVLAADFEDMATGLNHPVAGVTAIQNDVWYHAAVTYDGTTWRLYLNGRLDTELAANATPRYDSIQHFGLGTAMNSTGAQSGRLHGVLDEVRVWNYARSLAELQAAINTEITSPMPGLLGRWGLGEGSGTATADSSGNGRNGTIVNAAWAVGAPFDADMPPDVPVLVAPSDGSGITVASTPLTVHVSDYEAGDLEVKFYGRKLSSTPRPPFSIVAVPDTQFYSETYPATFTAQTQWIVNNRQNLNIAYVGHEGDLVNNSSVTQQWVNANTAISILDTLPDLPYGLSVGNHDDNPMWNPSGTATFNSYFPFTRYQGRSWYGGHYGSDNDNHYILFSAGGMDFIAIHFEYDDNRPQALFDWAGGLLQTHSNRRAIVVAHNILDVGTPTPFTSQGASIYNALKGYPNLFLMMCGHNHGEGMRTEVYQNRTVYVLLADYQSRSNGGDGWMRILRFFPDDNRIDVSTYSPTLNQYERDADSEFSLNYDMSGAAYTELGTVTVASNSDASFTWSGLEAERTFQWYATVSDGHSVVTSPAWSFTVNRPPSPEIGLSPTSFDRSVHAMNDLTDDTFTVANVGINTLNYTITDDASWLSVQPETGDSSGEADPIVITYNVAGLSVGTHTAQVTVQSGDAWNSPQTLTVTVHVGTAKPDLDLDGDVDQADFGHLQACLGLPGLAPLGPECLTADVDEDGVVGIDDVAILRNCIAGASTPTDAQCDD